MLGPDGDVLQAAPRCWQRIGLADYYTSGLVWHFLSGLRSWQLFVIAAALFIVDVLLADPLPFIDEILLGVLTLMLARWKRRRV